MRACGKDTRNPNARQGFSPPVDTWGVRLIDACEVNERYIELTLAGDDGARFGVGFDIDEAVDPEAVARRVAAEHRAILKDDPRGWRPRLAALLSARIEVTR